MNLKEEEFIDVIDWGSLFCVCKFRARARKRGREKRERENANMWGTKGMVTGFI